MPVAPRSIQFNFGIGINVGDIIIEGEDILGDGVNVAARIEGVAEPGGVSISRGRLAAGSRQGGSQLCRRWGTEPQKHRT